MKRFMLFMWWDYEASGGFNDLLGNYDSFEEAQAEMEEHRKRCSIDYEYENAQIVDHQTGKTVKFGYYRIDEKWEIE